MKSQLRSFRNSRLKQTACTVSAAALMLGVSHAATVAMHFQVNYCGYPGYTGFPVTATAFGVAPSGWQNLTGMISGYSGDCVIGPTGPFYITLSETVSTNTSTDGLNPLPSGTLNLTWSANTANFSDFGGYIDATNSTPYNIHTAFPNAYLTGNGEEEVYASFLRDGVNFGPPGGPDNTARPGGYVVDITGLSTVFTNTPFVVELIASSDSMDVLTNAWVIDENHSTSNSVSYPNTPPVANIGDAKWIRGHGGGLSTFSSSMSADHLRIVSATPAHGGTGGPPTGYNDAGTISGFIITDKPVVTMSPQPVLGYPGDSVLLSSYAIGVPPLSYQWRRNGVAVPGATATSLAIPSLNTGNMGNYQLFVSNAYGTAISSPAAVGDTIKESSFGNLVADSNPANPERDGIDNGATWVASSSDGIKTRSGVISFNPAASNNIVVTGSTNFDSATGTMMFWMRSPGTYTANGGSYGGAIFGRSSDNFNDSLFCVETDAGNLYLNTPQMQIQSVATVNDNKWHLIAASYDTAGSGAIYIDGVLDTTNFNGATWAPLVGQALQIGFSTNGTEYYNGLLDDVRFYNRKLSPTEVASVYANGALVDTNALQMQLNFNTAPVTGLELNWNAAGSVLQSAPLVTGPYKDLPGVTAPYYVVPSASQRYFRYHFNHTGQALVSNPYLM